MVVTLATFMEVLDTSIANVALPHIAGNLSASQDESTWVLTRTWSPTRSCCRSAAGSSSLHRPQALLHDLRGCCSRVSSFLCGIAPNLPLLIFFRVLQGVGGGGLQPSEQAILADTFPPEKRGMAFAVYGMAVVLAPDDRPDAGRLHHRQLFLALDLLHQRAGRDRCRCSWR